ncbi:hypothetical protein H4219_001530 [Mycoemilia scoparia]|uniref:Mitochondrial carrier n=1 Tax=Mycoemilia scoparia TaxID=417184 RepID=A0A9W8A091_9FUNG|nr:hypothetical protein H4219_001530 [Mycoemilia scoparia]
MSTSNWRDSVAGSAGGAMQVLVGHPLDTVKVRLQIEGSSKFRGPIDCLTTTVRNEGVLGLYKGMSSPLVGIAAVNSLLFWAYSKLKALQSGSSKIQATYTQTAIAGAGAGAVNTILSSPVELLKIRLQAQYTSPKAGDPSAFRNPVQLGRYIVREFGLRRGLFWGFNSTLLREVPAYAAFYTGFEFSKRHFSAYNKRRGIEDINVVQMIVSGSFAGVCCWLASYPFDVIKSKVQNSPQPPASASYIIETAKQIKAQQGWSGFLRGFTPTGKIIL